MSRGTGIVIKTDPDTGEYCVLRCPFCDSMSFFLEGVASGNVGNEVTCSQCSRTFRIKGNHFKGNGYFCRFRGVTCITRIEKKAEKGVLT